MNPPSPTAPAEKRAIKWIVSEDTGTSSKSIWGIMMGVAAKEIEFLNTPSDPSDFGRCYRLLKLIPEWEERLNELKSAENEETGLSFSPGEGFGSKTTGRWIAFVENYQEIKRLYEEEMNQNSAPKTYKFMKSIGL